MRDDNVQNDVEEAVNIVEMVEPMNPAVNGVSKANPGNKKRGKGPGRISKGDYLLYVFESKIFSFTSFKHQTKIFYFGINQ